MELRHLRYFVTVAETLNFTVAARRLGMAQPPLSIQIRNLERELGTALFERSNRRVSLTPAGHLFLKDAAAILQHADNAVEKIHDAAAGRLGTLALGIQCGTLSSRIRRRIRKFVRKHRGVRLSVTFTSEADARRLMAAGALDAMIGFIAQPALPNFLMLDEQPILIAVPKKHRLAERESLALIDLIGDRLILDTGDCPVDALLVRAAQEGGVPLTFDRLAGNVLERLAFVGLGLGICPCTASELEAISMDVTPVPLADPKLVATVGCLWSSESTSPALPAFRDFLSDGAQP